MVQSGYPTQRRRTGLSTLRITSACSKEAHGCARPCTLCVPARCSGLFGDMMCTFLLPIARFPSQELRFTKARELASQPLGAHDAIVSRLGAA